MLSVRSILVVVERSENARRVFSKACTLARHFGAKLELFLCEAERGYALRHAYDQAGIGRAAEALVDDARRYLEALRRSVDVPDLDIAVDASCETPEYQGIVQKVLMTGPDMVIKAIGDGSHDSRPGPGPNDWHLARTCPVPLLFMGQRPWGSVPRIAASVDPTDRETPGFAHQIVASAAQLAASCHGQLELVFGEVRSQPDVARSGFGAALGVLATEFGVAQERVHTLVGNPAEVLPQFVSRGHYDMVVLGALTHRQGATGLVGTLTDALMQVSDCDLLLLKPGTYARAPQPVARTADSRP